MSDIQLSAELRGIGALMGQFDQFDKKLAASALKKVARRGGNVFLKAVRAEAPRETGQLVRSLKLSVKVMGKIGQVSAMTSVKDSKKSTENHRGYIQRFVVRGTDRHYIPGRPSLAFGDTVVGGVEHPGAKANPYVDRAVDRNKQQATATVARELRVELDRLIAIGRARQEVRDLLR